MLKRQKILLGVLKTAGGRVQRTQFVKLVFLLGAEFDVRQQGAYYDFVPYKYGPFSFAMYRELSALERDGYVVSDTKQVQLREDKGTQLLEKIRELAAETRSDIREVVAQYGDIPLNRLLRDVYERYPWFAIASERHDLVPDQLPMPPKLQSAVYTVGYEGKSVDGFFDGLLHAGIKGILDIRANPISRKYGFARRSMSEICAKLGLQYTHLPELGISSGDRVGLGNFDSYQTLLDRYESEMLPARMKEISRLIDLLKAKPSALLCVEKDVRCCHRGRLATAASKAGGLPVIHL